MLKMIEDEISKIVNEEKTIYVLKGFDSIIKRINLKCEHIFDLGIIKDLMNIFYVDDEAAVLYGYKSAYPDLMLKYELEERLPTYQVDIDEKQSFRSVCRN